MPKVGLAEVARAAGVSVATVSRVLNNRTVVSPDTRRAVEQAVRRTGYARAALGNVVLLISSSLEIRFFPLLLGRISAALREQGYRAVIAPAPVGEAQELEFVAAMADAGMVAVVFASASNTLSDAELSVPRVLEKRRIPFICINGPFAGMRAPTLSTNDRVAAELSVDHLWSLGHRRVGLIAGPRGNRPSDRREMGFHEAMVKRGGEADLVVRHEYSIEGGFAAAEALLDRGMTALVAASDEMALGAIRAFRRAGMRVPNDMSVVGYDDAFPLEMMDPPLTTVRQPIERIAQALGPILNRLVQGREGGGGELLFDPELIVRGSTSPLNVGPHR